MTCTIISTGDKLTLPCKNETEPPYPAMKAKLREKIWSLLCQGYDRFYLNCEYGVPLWSAEIITALQLYNDIELHIVMPHEEQATNWPEEQRDRFFRLHEQADSVHIISKRYADDCYEQAEAYMAERSDLLLIVGAERGGDRFDISKEYFSIL